MGRDAILNDCAQHLRQSSFEFEQLLGSSVDTVWQALSGHVERQLLARKGVNVALLGKFAFLREVQPLAPVFVLADRFVSSYGVSWKRPPPALLTPTVDANLSLVGGEVGLPKEQTLRTLEALVAFLGSKLQKGTASGRLGLGNVGALCFDGKALSFAFHPSFVKAVNQGNSKKAAVEELRSANKLQRSASTDSGILAMRRVTVATTTASSATPATAAEELSSEHRAAHEHSTHHKKKSRSHKERHGASSHPATFSHPSHTSRSSSREATPEASSQLHHRHTRSSTHLDAPARARDDPADCDRAARQLLPRFLIASKSVPDDARVNRQTPGSAYALALQSAFERERELCGHNVLAAADEDAAIARRHHAAQLRTLQESAERALNRRELNAFLNGQIAAKHVAQRAERLTAARASDVERVTILPREPVVSTEARRDAKRSLCKRLDDQVAAKDALARDRRALEQAEAAYFSAQLQAQTAAEQRESLELKRRDKQALLDGWRQQQTLRADTAAGAAAFSSKRIR